MRTVGPARGPMSSTWFLASNDCVCSPWTGLLASTTNDSFACRPHDSSPGRSQGGGPASVRLPASAPSQASARPATASSDQGRCQLQVRFVRWFANFVRVASRRSISDYCCAAGRTSNFGSKCCGIKVPSRSLIRYRPSCDKRPRQNSQERSLNQPGSARSMTSIKRFQCRDLSGSVRRSHTLREIRTAFTFAASIEYVRDAPRPYAEIECEPIGAELARF